MGWWTDPVGSKSKGSNTGGCTCKWFGHFAHVEDGQEICDSCGGNLGAFSGSKSGREKRRGSKLGKRGSS